MTIILTIAVLTVGIKTDIDIEQVKTYIVSFLFILNFLKNMNVDLKTNQKFKKVR